MLYVLLAAPIRKLPRGAPPDGGRGGGARGPDGGAGAGGGGAAAAVGGSAGDGVLLAGLPHLAAHPIAWLNVSNIFAHLVHGLLPLFAAFGGADLLRSDNMLEFGAAAEVGGGGGGAAGRSNVGTAGSSKVAADGALGL